MEQVKLFIKGLSYSQTQSGAYALVLGEENGERRLPIIIGGFEAQSIAIALKKEINPPRPLTHDLFKSFAVQFHISLKEVVIHKLQDGVFYSILVCEHQGKEQVLDARTSDAVALAIRFNAPIFTYKEILNKAGIILKEGAEEDSKDAAPENETANTSPEKKAPKDLSKSSTKTLEKLLDQAVKNEDYEAAARLRDEIDKRL